MRRLRFALLQWLMLAAASALPAADVSPRRGLVDLPKLRAPREAVLAECDAARSRAMAIFTEVEPEISREMKDALSAVAADLEPGETQAEAWDRAAGLATVNADPAAALWAELRALRFEWRAEFAADAGILLAVLKHDDDARVLLDCAYDAGLRTPFLLEALANIHQRAGNPARSAQAIAAARALAPADPLIEIEHALFTTGAPPPAPQPSSAEPLERAIQELEKHLEFVLAVERARIELQIRVDQATTSSSPGMARQQREAFEQSIPTWRAGLDAVRSMMPMATMTPADARRMLPGMSDRDRADYRQATRNAIVQTLITIYFSLTNRLLSFHGTATIWEAWNVDFWGEVLGFEPIELARLMHQLTSFEHEGFRFPGSANSIGDLAGVEFDVLFQYAASVRQRERNRCNALNHPASEACRLEVDRQWCETVRALFAEWVAKSEGWFQRAARRFDDVAAGRIAWGGQQVEDAWRFAATCAKEFKARPGNETDAAMLRDLNERYAELVDLVAGNLDRGGVQGPYYQARYSADIYRLDKQNFEQHQAQVGQHIEEICQEVDRKVMEQLMDEHQRAVQEMLLERLLHDFNFEYDGKVNCSFSAGPWFSASIDDTGKVGISGKWKWLDKKIPDPETGGEDAYEVGRKYKVDFKDGEFTGASVGVEGGGRGGIFTGKGGVSVGAAWNKKTGQWDPTVEFSGTLGVGYKTKRFGAACYPGNVKIKFDPRVIAADATAYWHSLNGN